MLTVLITTGDDVVVSKALCQLSCQLAHQLCSNGVLLQYLPEACLLSHRCLKHGPKHVALPDGLMVLAKGVVTLSSDVYQVSSGLAQFVVQL